GMEAGRRKPAALPGGRKSQTTAPGALLALWPADSSAHGRLETGESPWWRHGARRATRPSQHLGSTALQPPTGHWRTAQPGGPGAGETEGDGRRLGKVEQRID